MIKILRTIVGLALLIAVLGFAWTTYHKDHPPRTDRALTADENKTVSDAIALMTQRRLDTDAKLASELLQQGKWRAATPKDVYINASEKSGDTPYAYTLSSGKDPDAIVLANRFFTDATPTARAALMIHELGHYQAYVHTGKSDEYDGYKAEYDKHQQIGLTDKDGIVYFGMLDGVVQYVVPRDPAYKNYPDIKAYNAESSPTP